MEFLKLLEGVRTPFGNAIFSAVTLLGEEYAFLTVVLLLLWCADKKWGYRLFVLGMAGTILNQLLKAVFLVPRPWVLDPTFTIVEAARAAALGYSFPSGHTQSVTVIFVTLGVWAKDSKHKRWIWPLCAFLILLTAFSRMYLGVHTPLDVGVSLGAGLLTVLLLMPVVEKAESKGRSMGHLITGLLVFSLIFVAYVSFVPAGERNVEEFDEDGLKTAYTLMGTVAGMFAAWLLDRRYIRFEVSAIWWMQTVKLVLGIAVIVGLRLGLKPPLTALTGGHHAADAIRYFVIALAGGALWPMAFKPLRAFGNRASRRGSLQG